MHEKYTDQYGFTLIEVIIVIAIIGVLAAIAIPQYNRQRQDSLNASVLSDLRNTANAQESYYVDHSTYSSNLSVLQARYDLRLSMGVVMDVAGSMSSYTMIAYHSSGNKTYTLAGPGGVISAN